MSNQDAAMNPPLQDEEDISLIDDLVVLDAEVSHEPGDVGRDRNNIGAHSRIACPW
jgi:hypothetical protein